MSSKSHKSAGKLATEERQKCINLLEKITKNMFRMFRNQETTPEQIVDKFLNLKKHLDDLWDVVLNAEYHREMKLYVERLWHTFAAPFDLEEIRSTQMTALNRLQKIKNSGGYKRDKKLKKRIDVDC